MAIEAIYNPDKERARAEARALNRVLDEYFHLVRKRIFQAVKNQNIGDWWDVNNLPALETMFETLCAKADKTDQDKLKIAGLVALILNFQEPSVPEGP
jgi:hypothetical protein